MKAATAQIFVDGKLILHATKLEYQGKELKLTGMILRGIVGKVAVPTPETSISALLKSDTIKNLEIRLSLF